MTHSFRALRAAVLAAAPGQGALPYGTALTAERLAALRGADHLRDLLNEMRAAAARAMSTPPPPLPFARFREFEDNGTRKGYENSYFDRRGRLLALATVASVDETDEPLPALEDLLWAICDEYAWAPPAHLPVGVAAARANRRPPETIVDLFAAETGHALAETLFLLRDRLHPWLDYRIRSEIERRVFRPLFHDPVPFGWESAANNWAAVCGGAVGMAAILLEGDRERLTGMLDRVLRALGSFLEGFAADGGCPEGIGYWVYGFGYYTYFAEMLHAFTGGTIDLLEGEKVARIAAFPAAAALSDERYVPFSDSFADAAGRTELPTGLVSRLAARIGAPVPSMAHPPSFHADHCYRYAHLTRTLHWTDPAALGRATPAGATFLPDLTWLVDRRDLGGVPVAFAAKGGHNGEPHNHNDLGHFVLQVGGENLLTDLGGGLYTRQYFREERYTSLHPSSEGHSVPIIAGQGQGAGRERSARVLGREARPDGADFALDLTRAYAVEGLQAFHRAFAWTVDGAAGEATLDLTDTFRFAAPPAALEEAFISLHRPTPGEGTATWRGTRGLVTLRFDAARLRPVVEELPSQDHNAEPITVYRLRLVVVAPVEAEETLRLRLACRVTSSA